MAYQKYSSRQLPDVGAKGSFVAKVSLAGGALLVACAVLGAIYNAGLIRAFAETTVAMFQKRFITPEIREVLKEDGILLSNFLATRMALIIYGAFFAGYTLAWISGGFRFIYSGIRGLMKDITPTNIPANLDLPVVVDALARRMVYRPADDGKTLQVLLGSRSAFVSPAAEPFARYAGTYLKGWVWRVIFLGLCGLAVLPYIWLLVPTSNATPPELKAYLEALASPALARIPLTAVAVAVVFVIAKLWLLRYILSLALPASAPSTDSMADTTELRFTGAPSRILQLIPVAARQKQWQGFPNRESPPDIEETKPDAVSRNGEFSGAIFIEQQPQVTSCGLWQPGKIALLSGWALVLLSVLILVFTLLPASVRLSVTTNQVVRTPGIAEGLTMVFALFFIARPLYRTGRNLISHGTGMLNTHWFSSNASLLIVKGVTSLGDVTYKASGSEVGSKRSVIQCELIADLWSAELVTEALQVDGPPRNILVTHISPEAQDWHDHLVRSLDGLASRGAELARVNLESDTLHDMIKANAQIAGLREAAKEQGRLAASANPLLPGQPIQTLPLAPRAPMEARAPVTPPVAPADLKTCPDCGEEVKAVARICWRCRYEFAPQNAGG